MPHIHELYDFTTSAYILHPTEPKLCLHFHKKLKRWLQPGGHIELDEDPLQALHRELAEEAGLQPSDYEIVERVDQPHPRNKKTIPIPFHINVHDYGENDHQHIDLMYLLRAKTTTLKPAASESQDIHWFSLEQVKQLHADGQLSDSTLDLSVWLFEHITELSTSLTNPAK